VWNFDFRVGWLQRALPALLIRGKKCLQAGLTGARSASSPYKGKQVPPGWAGWIALSPYKGEWLERALSSL
jgi:hypothetical protein